MTKALVSVEMDLASQIALKYACRLANLIKIKLGTIHVEKPDAKENVPSAGWPRNKWEDALIHKKQEELAALLKTPELNSPFLWNHPIVAVGNRDEEIMALLKKGYYDLFIEGRLATYRISKFYDIFDSLLYQNLTIPMIMVKNLVEIDHWLILFDDDVDVSHTIAQFFKIFGRVKINLDLLYYPDADSKDLEILEESRDSTALSNAKELLNANGLTVKTSQIVRGSPLQTSRYLRRYGMIASSIRWPVDSKKPLVELLGRVLCPIFISLR